MFCNKCGTENPDDVKFCSNCGAILKSISDEAAGMLEKDRKREYEPVPTLRPTGTSEGKEVKKVTLGGILGWVFGIMFGLSGLAGVMSSDFIAGISLLAVSAVLLPPVTRLFKEKMNIELSTGLKIVVIIICFIIFSMTVEPDTTPSSMPQQEEISSVDKDLIEKSASDMILTIDDVTLGWGGGSGGNDTCGHSSFTYRLTNKQISCTTTKHTTINEAKQVFLELKQECNRTKTVSVKLGDESIGYVDYYGSHAVFRKANVIVVVLYCDHYGTPDLRDAKNYAKKVEKKVK